METGPTTGDGSGADARRRLVDVQEQAAATREILEAMDARAPSREILDTIIERAARMCRADAAQLYLVEDQTFRLSRVAGHVPAEFRRHQEEHPMPAGRDSLLGRVAQDRTTQQIADVLADPGYGRHDLQHLAGYRALLSAPTRARPGLPLALTASGRTCRGSAAAIHDRELSLFSSVRCCVGDSSSSTRSDSAPDWP